MQICAWKSVNEARTLKHWTDCWKTHEYTHPCTWPLAFVPSHTYSRSRFAFIFDEFTTKLHQVGKIRHVHVKSAAAFVQRRISFPSNKGFSIELGCCRLICCELSGLRSCVGVWGNSFWVCRSQMWFLTCILSDKPVVLWSKAALSMSASCLAVEIKASPPLQWPTV